MRVNILFTASNAIGSHIIRGVTKESLSHVGIHINDVVIDSTILHGVRLQPYTEFISNKTKVISIPWDISGVHLWNLNCKVGQSYDKLGLLYLGLRYVIPALPKKNLWQTTGMFLCTEFVTDILEGKEDSMITPYKLYLKLIGSKS